MRNFSIAIWICGATATGLMILASLFFMRQKECIEVCIGTYGENIYVYEFNTRTFEFNQQKIAKARNASYSLIEDGVVYAVSETGADP